MPAGENLAHVVCPRREADAGAISEKDLAVGPRREACRALLGNRDVLAAALDDRGFTEGASGREWRHDTAHRGPLSLMHGVGVDVEHARAIAEVNEGGGDGGVVAQ